MTTNASSFLSCAMALPPRTVPASSGDGEREQMPLLHGNPLNLPWRAIVAHGRTDFAANPRGCGVIAPTPLLWHRICHATVTGVPPSSGAPTPACRRRPLLAMAAACRAGAACRQCRRAGPCWSSCSPRRAAAPARSADAAFARLLGRADVMRLAFHVTYWDRLGWRDTLGDSGIHRSTALVCGPAGQGPLHAADWWSTASSTLSAPTRGSIRR